jgi:nucleotidyltransferase substrate binding protein (TIGR01987 family)
MLMCDGSNGCRASAKLSRYFARAAIKAAFSARVIADGQLWIEMLDRRNLLTHTYDEKLLDETVQLLRARYLDAFERLRSTLEQKADE